MSAEQHADEGAGSISTHSQSNPLEWQIYTCSVEVQLDGAGAVWGCVLISPDNAETILQGVIPPSENALYTAEVMSVVQGLFRVPKGDSVALITDRHYLQEMLSGTRSGSPPECGSLWDTLQTLEKGRTVRFGDSVFATDKHRAHARFLAKDAAESTAKGMMPLATSCFSEFECAGSPGMLTVRPAGCFFLFSLPGIIAVIILLIVVLRLAFSSPTPPNKLPTTQEKSSRPITVKGSS